MIPLPPLPTPFTLRIRNSCINSSPATALLLRPFYPNSAYSRAQMHLGRIQNTSRSGKVMRYRVSWQDITASYSNLIPLIKVMSVSVHNMLLLLKITWFNFHSLLLFCFYFCLSPTVMNPSRGLLGLVLQSELRREFEVEMRFKDLSMKLEIVKENSR